MPYSQFTFSKVKDQFNITIAEGIRFFPDHIAPIAPSQKLLSILEDIPWAIAVDTEKARSEVIINPILLELRRIFERKISVFSGEEFNIDKVSGNILLWGSKLVEQQLQLTELLEQRTNKLAKRLRSLGIDPDI
jgi:hypothetical protein